MRKILFITGSHNQTTQMQQIASHLPGFDCWFSHLFDDSPLADFLINHTSLLNGTVLANSYRKRAEEYLRLHGLQIDYKAQLNEYELVVYCTDMVLPQRMRECKTLWVQEGMTDRLTLAGKIVKALNLPPSLCGNTALNGSTNLCDIYCVASDGYRKHFNTNGTDLQKLMVTGIPNYDDLQQYANTSFPHQNYVMVATTDMRETYRYENRPAFIKEAVEIADGRRLLFKLHPNENFERPEKAIRKYAPADTLIYNSGNTNEMIANCSELITQYSTVVYTGIALGKKVHSYFNIEDLKRLAPIQNKGTSAKNHECT